MTLAVSTPIAAVGTTANAGSYSFGSYTPQPNSVLVVAVGAADISGNGVTLSGDNGLGAFTLETAVTYNGTNTLYLFWKIVGSSQGPTTITFDCSSIGSATGVAMQLYEAVGVDVSTADPILQVSSVTSGTSSTSGTVAFSSAVDAQSAAIVLLAMNRASPSLAAPAGWLVAPEAGHSVPTNGLAGTYRVGGFSGQLVPLSFAIGTYTGLGVELAPSIKVTAQPVQQTAAPGSSASFSASMTGATSLQWQSAPPSSLFSSAPGVWSDIAGATSSTLVTPTLAAADDGTFFRLKGVSATDTSYTAPARVFLTGQPTFGKGAYPLGFASGAVRSKRRRSGGMLLRANLFEGDNDDAEAQVWQDWYGLRGTSGGVGSLATTLGPLTTTATGAVAISGASSITLGAMTASGAGTLAGTGAAAVTLGALTTTAAGSFDAVSGSGSAAITLGTMTTAAAGQLAGAGSAAIALGPLTTASAGAVALQGSSSIALGALTTSAAGALLVGGSAAITLGPLTTAALGALAGTGSASILLGALTTSSTGGLAGGGVALITLGPMTTSAVGALLASGSAAILLGPMTTAGAGALASMATAAILLDPMTTAAAGGLAIGGSLAQTLGMMTTTASGALAVTGSLSTTLGALTTAATGSLVAGVSANILLGPLTTTAAGQALLAGSSAILLGPLTTSAAGSAPISGAGAITLGTLLTSAAGALPAQGSASISLGDLLTAAQATVPVRGSASITLGQLTIVASGGFFTGGGATPEEIWAFVLSNGLTAGETLAQALAAAQNCCN